MITSVCVNKQKVDNRICGYVFRDNAGRTYEKSPEEVRNILLYDKCIIANLKLDKLNRIITIPKAKPALSNYAINKRREYLNIITKARALGKCEKIELIHNKYCIYVRLSSMKHLIWIPDDVEFLTSHIEGINNQMNAIYMRKFRAKIQEIRGKLIVVGGDSLVDIHAAFIDAELDYLDLTLLNTCNVVNMEHLFMYSKIKHIELTKMNTSRVLTMRSMFEKCQTGKLDLSNFDTHNLKDEVYMFEECKIDELDIGKLSKFYICEHNNGIGKIKR